MKSAYLFKKYEIEIFNHTSIRILVCYIEIILSYIKVQLKVADIVIVSKKIHGRVQRESDGHLGRVKIVNDLSKKKSRENKRMISKVSLKTSGASFLTCDTTGKFEPTEE